MNAKKRDSKTAAAILFLASFVAAATAQSIPLETRTIETSATAVTYAADLPASASLTRATGLTSATVAGLQVIPAHPEPVAFDPAKMMAVEDIRPGMKGFGLSVFSGLEPEKFDAEVIGVRHRMLAGTDIILCRLKSPHLVGLGVIAGMSGSPVFVDGKLIGAVAYGFTDVDDPLAGVTPIADMLKVYNSTPLTPLENLDDDGSPAGTATFDTYMALRANPNLDNLARVAMPATPLQPLTFKADEFGANIADQFHLPPSIRLEPLATPIFLSGSSSAASEITRTLFPSWNIITPQGASPVSTIAPAIPSTLAENSPGGPIADLNAFSDKISGGYALAVPFVEGDMNMAGVGTVTWRQGQRLVAFGHPMMQAGTVHFPMAAARINALIRSRTRPFKLGEPVGHVGMVRQDRTPAIGGLFGQTAKMFDVKTVIDDPAYLGRREFNYRIWNDRQMSPGLLMAVLGESIGTGARADGASAALLNYSIKLDDGTSITAEDYASDSGGTIMAMIGAMADTGVLMNNPFKPVGLDSVEFHMQVVDRLRQAKIESATMDKPVYQPGQAATVEWIMRPFRQEPVRLEYTFNISPDLPDGDYDLLVMDASERTSIERKRNPGSQKINDYETLVERVRENFPSNRIYITLVDQDTGVSVSGKEMPRLPGSIINAIQETVNSDYFAPVRGNYILDADVATTYEVSGQAKTTIKVERK